MADIDREKGLEGFATPHLLRPQHEDVGLLAFLQLLHTDVDRLHVVALIHHEAGVAEEGEGEAQQANDQTKIKHNGRS